MYLKYKYINYIIYIHLTIYNKYIYKVYIDIYIYIIHSTKCVYKYNNITYCSAHIMYYVYNICKHPYMWKYVQTSLNLLITHLPTVARVPYICWWWWSSPLQKKIKIGERHPAWWKIMAAWWKMGLDPSWESFPFQTSFRRHVLPIFQWNVILKQTKSIANDFKWYLNVPRGPCW